MDVHIGGSLTNLDFPEEHSNIGCDEERREAEQCDVIYLK